MSACATDTMRIVRIEAKRQANASAQKRYRERQRKKSGDMQRELDNNLLLANQVVLLEEKLAMRDLEVSVLRQRMQQAQAQASAFIGIEYGSSMLCGMGACAGEMGSDNSMWDWREEPIFFKPV